MILKKPFLLSSAVLFVLLFSVWLFGFVSFVLRVDSYQRIGIDQAQPETEAIIVLTGGSGRTKTGVDLLRANKGKKLLISGVYPSVEADQILSVQDISPALKTCCVVLGHVAENTRGNAREAGAFMKEQDFTSMRLVTAHYHMPRSLLLFRSLMPDMKITPHPVFPDVVDLSSWWRKKGTLSLLAIEYNKYMLARFRLSLEKI